MLNADNFIKHRVIRRRRSVRFRTLQDYVKIIMCINPVTQSAVTSLIRLIITSGMVERCLRANWQPPGAAGNAATRAVDKTAAHA